MDVIMGEEFGAGPLENDFPVLQHVGPLGRFQGIVDVLFNQEDGGSFLVDPVDDLEDHADKKGG